MGFIRIIPEGLDWVRTVLQAMHDRGVNTRPLMSRFGVMMLATVDRNFEAEGRPDKWKERTELSNKNLRYAGMERASNTKRYQNAAKFSTKARILRVAAGKMESNKILQDSGALRKSIHFRAANDRVEVGPTGGLPYVRIHQLGGIVRPVKANALAVPCGGRILRLRKVEIPARPYLTMPPEDIVKYAQAAMGYLQGASDL